MSSTPYLDAVTIRGNGLTKSLRDRCTGATLDGSISEVTQLSLKFTDPGWVILSSGLFTLKASVAIDTFNNFEIAAVTLGDDMDVENLTIKCRPKAVRLLKQRRGTKVMKNASPSEFVASECKAVSVPYKVETSGKRKTVARDVPKKGTQEVQNPPSSWTTFKRLADEVGYIIFESAGTIYFGRPSWIVSNAPAGSYAIRYKTGADDAHRWFSTPSGSRSLDSPAQTVSGDIRADHVGDLKHGTRLIVTDVPTFNGQYLITQFSLNLLDTARICNVTAGVALNEDPSEDTGRQPRRATRLAKDFVYWAKAQVGNRYAAGVQVDLGSVDPAVFETSELVEWAAAQVGVYVPSGALNIIQFCAANGTGTTATNAGKVAGAILFDSRSNRIGISIGGNQIIEHVNGKIGIRKYKAVTIQYNNAALIPNLLY
jgi:hypothetical protein